MMMIVFSTIAGAARVEKIEAHQQHHRGKMLRRFPYHIAYADNAVQPCCHNLITRFHIQYQKLALPLA